MSSPWVLVLATIVAAPIYAGLEQKTDVVRDTSCGKVSGFVQEIHRGRAVESYLGIPYATPPVGDLRFEEPRPPDCWLHEIRDATELPPACLQFSNNFNYIVRYRPGFRRSDEDCLYLNVHVPVGAGGDLPVMVYIHGGSNMAGMGAYFDGDTFTAFGQVILVTVNHRIGTLGFMGTGRPEFPGNYGLLDQVMSFRWVKNNIASFGGDPSKVTITGHSSGAFNVGLHLVSPLSTGLFRSIVCMSGSTMTPVTVRKVTKTGELIVNKYASLLKCDKGNLTAVKRCLKTRPASLIMTKSGHKNDNEYQFPAIIDGNFLPDYPEKIIKTGTINTESIMGGVTKDEGYTLVFKSDKMNHMQQFMIAHKLIDKNDKAILESIRHEYTNWDDRDDISIYTKMLGDGLFDAPLARTFDLLSQHHHSKLFTYRFEYISELAEVPAAMHGSDLFYLFGAPLSGHLLHNFTDNDRTMSCMYISMFSSFVRGGIPRVSCDVKEHASPTGDVNSTIASSHTTFVEYTSKRRPYVAFNLNTSGVPQAVIGWNLKPRKMAFWNELVPSLRKLNRCPRPPFTLLNRPSASNRHEKLYVVLFGVFLSVSVILIVAFVVSLLCRRKQAIVVTL